MTRIFVVAVVAMLVSACASYKGLRNYDRPMVASMGPVEPVTSQAPDPTLAEESAGALLERAFALYHQDELDGASKAFGAAIMTGDLNDAGRALAYWHIADCERRMGNADNAAEALSSFIFVAQEVVDLRDERRFAVDQEGDFIDHFRLVERISEARAYMSAVWASRVDTYGRSLEYPVRVETNLEAELFLEFAQPCNHGEDASSEREVVVAPGEEQPVERVTIYCTVAQRAARAYPADRFYLIRTLPKGTD